MAVIREQAGLFRRHRLDQHSYYSYRLTSPTSQPTRRRATSRTAHPPTTSSGPCSSPGAIACSTTTSWSSTASSVRSGCRSPPFTESSRRSWDTRPTAVAFAPPRSWGPACARSADRGFVFKPMEGIRGDRVLVFSGAAPDDPDAWVTLAGERYDAERLVAATADGAELVAHNPGADTRRFLIEERVRPHPTLEELLGPTLCSVRVQTIVSRAGAPEILAAVFKLQTGTSGVDHVLHGAVGCWVEPETGVLGRGRSRTDDRDVSTIPGTDRSFIGLQLPDWDAVRDVALRAAAAFPWARSIGWDIGVSERGPLLIEGNERWSPSLIQMPAPRGLMTGEMKALCDHATVTAMGLIS
ncbi:MAG: sugar-transfer associated ATP-grasp domain-containing protein [Gemmatimonadales bacterium]